MNQKPHVKKSKKNKEQASLTGPGSYTPPPVKAASPAPSDEPQVFPVRTPSPFALSADRSSRNAPKAVPVSIPENEPLSVSVTTSAAVPHSDSPQNNTRHRAEKHDRSVSHTNISDERFDDEIALAQKVASVSVPSNTANTAPAQSAGHGGSKKKKRRFDSNKKPKPSAGAAPSSPRTTTPQSAGGTQSASPKKKKPKNEYREKRPAASPKDKPLLDETPAGKTDAVQTGVNAPAPMPIMQPEETLTDLQTTIPVKLGTGNTRPHTIKKERELRRKRDERLTYLLVFFILVFAVSAFFLIRIFWGYSKASSEYAQLEENYVKIPEDADKPVSPELPSLSASPFPNLEINFAKLYAINNDLIGWIYVPACGISYPLVQGDDNDYYLKYTFEKNPSSNGAIFMDYQDNPDFTSFNTFIYGHNMRDGSMFASLFKYGTDAELIDSYPYFYIYLSNGNVLKYHICSFYTNSGNSDSYLRVDTIAQKSSYVAMILAKSKIVKSEASLGAHLPTADDSFVTLSTCHTSDDRFLVHGYLEAIYNTLTNSVNEIY